MPITSPVPIEAGPVVPSSSTPELTFDAQYEAFNAWERNQLQPGANALAENVFNNATDAAANATTAAANAIIALDQAAIATAAASSAGAVLWVSGTTYTGGYLVYSPINKLNYRRNTTGAGAIDPSIDETNWTALYLPIAEVTKPTNTSPANAATAIGETPTFTGSGFFSLYSATHSNTQVQVHTSNVFTSPLYDSGSVAGSVSFTMPSAILSVSTAYFWRIRYKNNRGTWSDWSLSTGFTTAATFNAYITTPTATPAAFGDAFEGGFYTGMIWNELVQSATSYTIGTGSKAFTVADMTATPLVYAGQTLEVRSRANPANKMIGTVTVALGTTLTINVTSVGGSGTFTDWSIMARYRLIVAPKSSGENASIAYKNANTAAPTPCGTLSEGRKATLAMVAADSSTVYPAAHWCNSLTIGGKNDWYLPARDELELCWRNLKPSTASNYISARPGSTTPNYTNLGSYADSTSANGENAHSSPFGSAYTAGTPTQSGNLAFRTAGLEAFEAGSYKTSTDYNLTSSWKIIFSSGFEDNDIKDTTNMARAVRRSII